MVVDSRMSVLHGDITRLNVDAIVNAANGSLLGGGGVDGAIHMAAGPNLLEECRQVGGCPTGEARITQGYCLPAAHVIHAVGPTYSGSPDDARLLRSAYEAALHLARENGIRSIAFPCISTGVYGYPKDEACDVAVETVAEWLERHELPHDIIFCCFDDDNDSRYRRRVDEWRNRQSKPASKSDDIPFPTPTVSAEAAKQAARGDVECPTCGGSGDSLAWEWFCSSHESWHNLAGKAGWRIKCQQCGLNVGFLPMDIG